jgi:hypothetical protein
MSSSIGSELWNEELKLVSFCPVCDTRYNPMKARVLDQKDETHLLHVTCHKCNHSILALVLINQAGASSVGLLTDLNYEDVVRFASNGAVELDDVIKIHDFFEGDSWQNSFQGPVAKQAKTTRRKTVKNVRKKKAAR